MSDAATVLLLERVLSELQGLRADLARKSPPAPAVASEPEGLLTVKQASELTSMSESWLYQRSASGELPCVRLGHAIRFERAALLAYARGAQQEQGRVLPLPKAR